MGGFAGGLPLIVSPFELRQVFLDWVVERQLSLVDQDHDDGRGNRLGTRCHEHLLVDGDIAERFLENDLTLVGQQKRDTGHGTIIDCLT